ncbi:MAG: hypothetical protein ACYCT2_04430 [Thermoplasmataceae archaeon]
MNNKVEEEIDKKIREFKNIGYDVEEVISNLETMRGNEEVLDWYSIANPPNEKNVIGDILIVTNRSVIGINFEKDRKYEIFKISKKEILGLSIQSSDTILELQGTFPFAGFKESFRKNDADKLRKIIEEIKKD